MHTISPQNWKFLGIDPSPKFEATRHRDRMNTHCHL
jgi:hypothetical protein